MLLTALALLLTLVLPLASAPAQALPLGTEPPEPVEFEVTLVSPPDADGVFRGSISVRSLLADVPVKMVLNPTEGIQVLTAPQRLAGRALRRVPVTFDLVARIDPTAPRPAGLNVELRLRYPAAAALSAYRLTLPAADGPLRPVARRTLDELEAWAAGEGGGPVVRLDRSFFFPEVLR